VAARTQVLVQLTDELVERLDRRASKRGVSRSRLIRELLEEASAADRDTETSRRLVEGYRRAPQTEWTDDWGDLEQWSEELSRRNLAALRSEEQES
jgi:predicted transcriptional regulator